MLKRRTENLQETLYIYCVAFVFYILKQKNLRHSRTMRVRTEIKMQKWELSVSTNTSQFLKNEKKYH